MVTNERCDGHGVIKRTTILVRISFILQKENEGIVMINFYNGYVSCNASYANLTDVVGKIPSSVSRDIEIDVMVTGI